MTRGPSKDKVPACLSISVRNALRTKRFAPGRTKGLRRRRNLPVGFPTSGWVLRKMALNTRRFMSTFFTSKHPGRFDPELRAFQGIVIVVLAFVVIFSNHRQSNGRELISIFHRSERS